MPKRTATASWTGNLKDGEGRMTVGSGAFDKSFSVGTRIEDDPGTNPEELIGAAHAGCYSMALAKELVGAGYEANKIDTSAEVSLKQGESGFQISTIHLSTKAKVPKISADEFATLADHAKHNCVVSKALSGTQIELDAKLVN